MPIVQVEHCEYLAQRSRGLGSVAHSPCSLLYSPERRREPSYCVKEAGTPPPDNPSCNKLQVRGLQGYARIRSLQSLGYGSGHALKSAPTISSSQGPSRRG